jgi:hypothetical protein
MADRVVFLRPDAERIARAVRRVEGLREATPLTFRRVMDDSGRRKAVRICTFTGAWSVGSSKTVTFKNQTNTPNTVSATNLFLPLPSLGTRDCAIARDGVAWYLIQAQFDSAAFVTDATLTTTALQFNRYNGLALGTASSVSVSVTTCATAS